jgi:DNA-directed RNA polymerase specialized sigma24 family protein
MHDDSSIRQLLARAKRGDAQALGDLLESYRSYIRLLARQQIYRRLEPKLAASELVQKTFLRARRSFTISRTDRRRATCVAATDSRRPAI